VRVALLVITLLAGCADGVCSDCVTATLTANDAVILHSHPGDLISYAWSSTHADSASSSAHMSTTVDGCGYSDGPWVIHSPNGTLDPQPLLECQRGTTYVLSFTATDLASGQAATAELTIAVE
jgi:hypothetical protein